MLLSLIMLALSLSAHGSPKTGMVDYRVFAQWPASKQITYVRDVRHAFAQFETPTKINWTESTDPDLCVVGGILRERVRSGDGRMVCPTTGNPCEPLGDDGFACGLIYDAACVSRTPVATLTKRCEAQSDKTQITRHDYEQRRESIAEVATACEEHTFARAHADNCGLFLARLAYLNAKYEGDTDQRAAEALALTMTPPEVPATPIARPEVPAPTERAPICRGTPYRIDNDGGGDVDTFIGRANALKASGRKLEIKGFCASACLLYLAKVPKDRICVGPRAQLGFHQASDAYGRVDHAYTEWAVRTYYSPELKALWANHYSNDTQINLAHYQELARYYPTCDGAGDKCSVANRASAPADRAAAPFDGTDGEPGAAR